MPWVTDPNTKEQYYQPDEEEQDPDWCFMHDAQWPACEDGEAEQ